MAEQQISPGSSTVNSQVPNSTTVKTRPKRDMKTTQQRDFVYPSTFHNRPVEGKKAKEIQRKEKQARMKAQPENLNWDYQHVLPKPGVATTMNSEPCDVQFYSNRVVEWKQECSTYYGVELGKPIAWKPISGGDQLTVLDHITINFYVSNIILVQGKDFVHWGETIFKLLQQRIEARHAESQAPVHCTTVLQSEPNLSGVSSSSPAVVSTPVRPAVVHDELTPTGNVMLDLLQETSFCSIPNFPAICESSDHVGDLSSITTDSQSDRDSSESSSDIDSDSSSDSDSSEIILNIPETQLSTQTVNNSNPNLDLPLASSNGDANNRTATLDSLLASPAVVEVNREDEIDKAIAEKDALTKQLTEKEAELESERDTIMKLKREVQLMKTHLSDKDWDIKNLERDCRNNKQELAKVKKQSTKQQKQTEALRRSSFDGRKQSNQLDAENISLRTENRQLQERVHHLSEQLALMTAKYESLQQPKASANQTEPVAPTPNSAWALPRPKHQRQPSNRPVSSPKSQLGVQQPKTTHTGGARPKVVQKQTSLPSSTTSKNSKPMKTRKACKTRVAVIGASNLRNVSSKLQTKDCDTIALVNPGCKVQDLQNRVQHMIHKNTDVAVLHLGTNNALSDESDRECMDNSYAALEMIEHHHISAHPEIPMLVCSVPPTANRRDQRRVDMLNALFKYKCEKSKTLHFLDTGLDLKDIGRDGIHLTPDGKNRLAQAILAGVQDFQPVRPRYLK